MSVRGWSAVDVFLSLCESPIERAFALAFIEAARTRNCVSVGVGDDARGGVDGCVEIAVASLPAAGFLLMPQFDTRDYRCDFRIWRKELLAPVDCCVELAVECDGHDFHNRTPEQARRDRARDRALALAGLEAFRFTGSEIYRDARACAESAIEYMDNRACEIVVAELDRSAPALDGGA